MVEWQEEVARCVYQELGTYVEENPGTSDFILEPSDNGIFSFGQRVVLLLNLI